MNAPSLAKVGLEVMFGPDEVRRTIPQREPFVLIDGIVDYRPGERCTSYRYVDPVDPVFRGHFPGEPVLPGVHLIENMAQTGCFLVAREDGEKAGERFYVLARVSDCSFNRPVKPGETVLTEAEITRRFDRVCILSCRASVGGEKAAQAELIVSSVDRR